MSKDTIFRFVPLEAIAKPSLMEAIKAFQAKWQKDYPGIEMPRMLVPLPFTPRPGLTENDQMAENVFQDISISPALYVSFRRTEDGPQQNAIIISPYVLPAVTGKELLTDKEIMVSIGHEIGHHVLGHAKEQLAIKEKGDMGVYFKTVRINECEADHFVAHYMPDAHIHENTGHLKWATDVIMRQRGYPKELAEMNATIQRAMPSGTHPAIVNRLAMMEAREVISRKPGSVDFTDQCKVVPPTVPNERQADAKKR